MAAKNQNGYFVSNPVKSSRISELGACKENPDKAFSICPTYQARGVGHIQKSFRLDDHYLNGLLTQGAPSMPTQRSQLLAKFFVVFFMTITWCTLSWAVYPPEPQSGGRFFSSKGTKGAQEYRYLGRTGVLRDYEDYYYGKGLKHEIFNVRPYLSYTGDWDSNVFLTDDDEASDYISRLNWGADGEMVMEEGKYVLSSGIHSESEWFAQHGDENHTDWVYQLGGEMNFTHFQVKVFEEFQRTVNRAGTELTNRLARNENYLSGLITIPFGQFFHETEVSHYKLEFRDPVLDLFDRQEFRVVPRLGMDVGDRTQALVEYDITNINYDSSEDRNGDAHQVALGARGFLGEGDLVTYQAWAGWQVRNYDSDARDDFSGFVFRSNVEYRRSELSKFYLEANRRPVESVSTTNSYIVRNEVAARWRRQITEKLGGELQGFVGFDDYSNGRLDFYWEPGTRLDYLLPGNVAHLFTEYRYTGRHSDASNSDYMRHLVSFGIRFEV